ncbi:MAG TPA: PilZ domain-containing protein [Terriglobales bacterium]|nr:PilZ domain-containing protein [Terriglobales bacterium]
MHDKRKYERVNLPETAKIYVADEKGARLGAVRVLGLGGVLVATPRQFAKGEKVTLAIVDESEGIRRKLKVRALYTLPIGVGFEFGKLDEQSAVEMGVIIGKHKGGT